MREPLRNVAEIHYGKSPAEVLVDNSDIPILGTGGSYGRASRSLFPGPAVVVPRKGSLGNPQFVATPFWASDTTYAVVPKSKIDAKWLYYSLDAFDLTKLNEATGVPSISRDWLYRISFETPSFSEQRRIAEILTTLDETIEQTEALIAKNQQIKAGLMHDLFTRGVTPNGRLRPTRDHAPHLYKDSPLGWIPKEWETLPLGVVAESLHDGPFGSNLKTEHYVEQQGVLVVRLQNIQATRYNDSDRAYISAQHAQFLNKHKVVQGDILIAALGEERYPVGRACLYPAGFEPAINKADCVRLRCQQSTAENEFVMYFLNTYAARRQIARYEQGVTRPRINTGNLKSIKVTLPAILEQQSITRKLSGTEQLIQQYETQREKLVKEKHGLMHDLLTGRVRVKVREAAAA